MKSLLRVALAICIGIGSVNAARADIIVDTLTTGITGGNVTALSNSSAFQVDPAGSFLGQRTTTVSLGVTGNAADFARASVSGGVASFGTTIAPPGTGTANFSLLYNGFGSLNLTNFTSVDLQTAHDPAGTASISLFINGSQVGATQVIPSTAGPNFGPTSFALGATPRSNVTSIEFKVVSTNNADAFLGVDNGGIRIREAPEPTSIAIFGIFAVGGYVVARRRRQAA